ncbi:MAG: hypothetical protein JSV80_16020 [Acidobacteriota bacterium]|nr:MAG: hypothetical protein JSV80_16020 [Acidobacteriota bacterium]
MVRSARYASGAWKVAFGLLVVAALLVPSFAQLEELSSEQLADEAFTAIRRGRFVRARELASEILSRDPDSIRGELALGIALHEGEGFIPLALRHYQRARWLSEGIAGLPRPGYQELHREILHHERYALADLGRYEQLLAVNATIRELYDPELHSADVWPLMKLGRVDEASAAIERALATGDPQEEVVAKNGRCAIEGYTECLAVLEAAQRHDFPLGLAYRNAGVSAALVGQLDEAERLLVSATQHPHDDTNPWRDLTDLYLIEGRLGEAAAAARQMFDYGRRMPPRQRQYSHAEQLVSGAEMLLLAGRADRALLASQRAIDEPDRAAHWSGSAAEIRSEGELLHRAIHYTLAERAAEAAAIDRWLRWPLWSSQALWHRVEGWLAGRRVLPLVLSGGMRFDEDPHHPTRPDLSGPLWLLLDAVSLLGPGPTLTLIADAEQRGAPESSPVPAELRQAVMDAVECEARWQLGQHSRCLQAGRSARERLPGGSVLLRVRLAARMAHAAWRLGRREAAWELYAEVLERDPGALRRLSLALPVSVAARGDSTASAARQVLRTPRFVHDASSPFQLVARGETLCLAGAAGALLACADESRAARAATSEDLPPTRSRDRSRQLAAALLDVVFSPRLDLSQQDLSTLDGTPVVTRGLDRDALGDLIGPPSSRGR